MQRLLTALIAVVLGLSGLAACGGGDSDEEYKDDFPPISRDVVSLGEEVGEAIQNAGDSTDDQLAEDFSGFARRLGELDQRLGELEPPDDLSGEQEDLSEAIGEVQASLEGIADAAEQGDPDAARQATIDLVERSERLREARRALAQAVDEL